MQITYPTNHGTIQSDGASSQDSPYKNQSEVVSGLKDPDTKAARQSSAITGFSSTGVLLNWSCLRLFPERFFQKQPGIQLRQIFPGALS